MEIQTRTYPVKNMTCAACARSVENMLKFTDGVEDASVNYASAQVKVKFNADKTDFDAMQNQVRAIGYDLVEEFNYDKLKIEKQNELAATKRKFIVALIFSIPVFLLSMVFTELPLDKWIMLILTIPVVLYSGRNFYISAYQKIMHWQFNMDTLIALGTGSAILFSLINTFFPSFLLSAGLEPHVYYESAVVIITLILLGNYIEEKAKAGTNRAVEKLMDLQVKTARLIQNGSDKNVPLEEIKQGDIIRILPGEKIPIDGVVFEGKSYVDESMLTGESEASLKEKNSRAYAGTLNQNGSLSVKTEKVGNGTLLGQVIQLVQDAQGSKAPAQKLADKISSIFVPTVIGISILSFIIWMIVGPQPVFTNAFVVLITVLIIACPCALGLATPTAITVGIGKGASNGILIKDAEALEKLSKINALAIDKTGTITEGKPSVYKVYLKEGADKKLIESLLYSSELKSEHPIANSIVEFFSKNSVETLEIENFSSFSGYGIKFKYQGKDYNIGRPNWNSNENENQFKNEYAELNEKGMTIVELSCEGSVLALIGVRDQIKKEVANQIHLLKSMGIEIIMLTGDRKKTAELVAKEVGIDKVFSELLPKEKAEKIKEIQDQGMIVAMAGDGINDSPALAQSDIGIAMGTGNDIAIESAGITLLKGDLSKIQKALKLSYLSGKTIKQNLFWAFFYNIIAIPIAAGILYPFNGFLLNPMIAGGAMAFSSVTVVLNSLRLKMRRIN